MNKKRLTSILSLKMAVCLFLLGSIAIDCNLRKNPTGIEKRKEIVFPGKEWEERAPESQGVDSGKLNEALKYLESKCGKDGIREVVVIRNGYMIWKGDNIDNQHSTWSVGKVFTSTALGLLVEDGLCTLDDFASKYEPLLNDKYPGITFRHFATMTSGYDAPKGARWEKPVPAFGDWSPKPYIPGTPLFSPGEAYLYWDEAMMMFGRVLTIIADRDLLSLLKERITDPIGINEWDWGVEGIINKIPINNPSKNIHRSQANSRGRVFALKAIIPVFPAA